MSKDGNVTGLKKGSATIYAAALDGSGLYTSCNVTVTSTAHLVEDIKDFQSEHNYKNKSNEVWIYTIKGADSLQVTFSEQTKINEYGDYLYLYDATGKEIGKYTGTELAGKTISVSGNMVKVRLVSDDSLTAWGFSVDKVETGSGLVELTGIKCSPSSVIVGIGDAKKLQLIAVPDGAVLSGDVQWKSNDETIVQVTEGENYSAGITAIKPGKTTITATIDKMTTECSVTVLQEAPTEYTITLDYQGGQGTKDTITAMEGKPLQDLADLNPVRDGYMFLGWYTKPNGEGEFITEETLFAGYTTLYAYWKEVTEDDTDELWVKPIANQYYTGKAIKPIVQVYVGNHGKKLEEKIDYTISYKNNIKTNDASVSGTAPTVIVTGIGNYEGKSTVTFKILPVDLEYAQIDDMALAYKSGKTQQPNPIVKWNGKTLKNNVDYSLSYPDAQQGAYQNAGTYTIKVTGRGNFTGSRDIRLTITNGKLINNSKVVGLKSATYTGQAICPEPTIKLGTTLIKDVDYTLSYENNIEVGTAYLIIRGKGDYAGVKRIPFKIVGQNLAKAFCAKIDAQTYSDEELEPEPILSMNGIPLTKNKDYTVSYQKNLKPGNATIVCSGLGQYAGTVKKVNFKINACPLTDSQIRVTSSREAVYCKGGAIPEIEVTFKGKVLTKGIDYILTAKNNKVLHSGVADAKQPTVVIKGKGNFKDSISVTYGITQKDLKEVTVSVPDVVYKNKAGAWKSKPILIDTDGKKLAVGKDYDAAITYRYVGKNQDVATNDIPEAGVVIEVLVNAKVGGCYTGETVGTYRIVEKSIGSAKVTKITKSYTGKEVILTEQDLMGKISVNQNDLQYGKDYEIVPNSYVNNIKKGNAKVTIRGIGNYGGTKTITFSIKSRTLLFGK